MSLDIDWSLLSDPAAASLSESLITALNAQLNRSTRPSFLGPITVTSFDFGTQPPELEIKDIRDVWRAFDEGDDEGDAILAAEAEALRMEEFESHFPLHHTPPQSYAHSTYAHSHSQQSIPARRLARGRHASAPPSRLPTGLSTPNLEDSFEPFDDSNSVHSGFHSGRNSVASVGIGVSLRRRYPLVPSTPPRVLDARARVQLPDSAVSPPPSPPARPSGVEERANPLPSVQMHLRLDHASNLSLTLNTSLQVNYPSPLFMTLPLKLVITGLTLAADIVIAYSGQKHRVHVTIVDSGTDDPPTPGVAGYTSAASPYAVGQRVLPSLHIESEIGSADAHVLRNVGKVERFIVDAVRKTLVDELVFPNFQTIAL